MKDANEPDVAGSVEDQRKEQTDTERRGEDDCGRRPGCRRRKVVEVQRPKGEDDVRGQRSPNTAEAPRQLSLKNAPIVEFLIEPPEKLYDGNCRDSGPDAKAFPQNAELLEVQRKKDRVCNYHDLSEIELLGRSPLSPRQEADIAEADFGPEPDGENGCCQEEKYP